MTYTSATAEAYEQRIDELEAELEEMTGALAQAWDQLVPFLQAAPAHAESTRDIAPLLESIMAAVDAPMGIVYLIPHANRPAEWFAAPMNVMPIGALQQYLDELTTHGKPVHVHNVLAWHGRPTNWMLTPLMVSDEVVGVIGVGLDDYRRELNSADARIILRMTERVASQFVAADLALSKAREAKLAQELQIAGNIQRSIQPTSEPQVVGVEVVADWQPAAFVGGDVWGWVQQSSGRLACFMVDVAGKGLPAALAAVSLHTALKTALSLDYVPADVLRAANKEFYDSYTQTGILATVTIITLDPETGIIEHANAGHTPTLVWREQQWWRWKASMPPLGVLPDAEPVAERVQLCPNDVILLYSDGFSEIETAGGFWTEQGLVRAVSAQAQTLLSAHSIVSAILAAAGEARMHKPLHDDQTLVAIRYTGGA